MIIGTCGFCSTGSSAVSDYLKEFDELQVLDKIEFTFAYLPDGLEDLYYHLSKCVIRDDSSAIAIPRFRRFIQHYSRSLSVHTRLKKTELEEITNHFLDSIIQMRWRGERRSDTLLYPNWFRRYIGGSLFQQRIIPFLNKRLHKCVEIYPYRELELSVNYPKIEEACLLFLKNLLFSVGADFSKHIVLDQPFAGNNPQSSFHFFEDPYAIVVDRDPRDNYIFAREFLYKRKKYMPINNVKEFVHYYRLMRDNMPYKEENARILRMNFEEMVYDYDNATIKIEKFLNLGENKRKLTIFDPRLSINNTQLILKFPQYKDDVKYIEDNLSEYLFDFSRYPKPDNSGEMFMGKSPLNK